MGQATAFLASRPLHVRQATVPPSSGPSSARSATAADRAPPRGVPAGSRLPKCALSRFLDFLGSAPTACLPSWFLIRKETMEADSRSECSHRKAAAIGGRGRPAGGRSLAGSAHTGSLLPGAGPSFFFYEPFTCATATGSWDSAGSRSGKVLTRGFRCQGGRQTEARREGPAHNRETPPCPPHL